MPESDAFAVWFAKTELELDDEDAFDALAVGGPNEKGMDVFWIDQLNQRVMIAQCKYSSTGQHSPKEKDLNTLLSCTDWLAAPEALKREGRSELVAAAQEYQDAVIRNYPVQLWFVYCGKRDANIEKRIRVYNANEEHVQQNRRAIHCDLQLLENMYDESQGKTRRIDSAEVKVDRQALEIEGTFGEGLVTNIMAPQLVSLYNRFRDELFAKNVRGWLGARRGSVNASMIDTIGSTREQGNFWAYNNGITIVCDDFDHSQKKGTLKLANFSIVNGCQTTRSLELAQRKNKQNIRNVSLLLRVVKPPLSIVGSIVRFTNSQNLIRRWDLVSQERTQKRLQVELASLDKPVYYVLRRGDWKALDKKEKQKYHDRINHDLLAQYLASFKGIPVIAYKNKAFLFDIHYDSVFPPDIRVEEALFVWKAGRGVQELVREEIKTEGEAIQSGDRSREPNLLVLKRGGRFFVLSVFGLVASLRNGPDYLRSITESRITSRAGAQRIDKYAKISIQWYKQAVTDLLQTTGLDLSTLIRTQDFFEHLAERTTIAYKVASVNEDWLEGALPEFH